ncbi:uncharacterized protein TNCV_2636661 [Trichonephila clavipes]|uniref:HTH CENPB-type domain-containing protein n=1 Tax=Trichonephila clavipes TaxID=2585209 RepID=A0A8X6R292_TRICX|nr:uncharacterized protein TNCV_2636661 [Trichonephila clavipes]
MESVEEGERKVDVAKAFEIPLSSLSTILKNKEKIFSASSSRVRKRVSKGNFPRLEQCLASLMRQCRGQNIPMSGSLLKEKTKAFAKELGIEFSASEGWLTNFKKRNGNLGGRTGKILRPSSVALKSKNQEINRLQLAVKLPWAIFFESVDILS